MTTPSVFPSAICTPISAPRPASTMNCDCRARSPGRSCQPKGDAMTTVDSTPTTRSSPPKMNVFIGILPPPCGSDDDTVQKVGDTAECWDSDAATCSELTPK